MAQANKPRRPRMNIAALRRANSYLGHYPRIMAAAYGALAIATLAQLVIPTLVRNIIDAITNGVIASRILAAPIAFQPQLEQATGMIL